MQYIIDTHVLLWIVTNNRKLSKKAKEIFLNESNEIVLSLASLWEIAIKVSLKRLSLGEPLANFIKTQILNNNINILNINIAHIVGLESLPYYHRDPFDRLIIAQSIVENIPIITSDNAFNKYQVKRIWK